MKNKRKAQNSKKFYNITINKVHTALYISLLVLSDIFNCILYHTIILVWYFHMGVIPVSIPVLSTEAVLCLSKIKKTVDRGLQLSTEITVKDTSYCLSTELI